MSQNKLWVWLLTTRNQPEANTWGTYWILEKRYWQRSCKPSFHSFNLVVLKISFGSQNSPEQEVDSKTCAIFRDNMLTTLTLGGATGTADKGHERVGACPGQGQWMPTRRMWGWVWTCSTDPVFPFLNTSFIKIIPSRMYNRRLGEERGPHIWRCWVWPQMPGLLGSGLSTLGGSECVLRGQKTEVYGEWLRKQNVADAFTCSQNEFPSAKCTPGLYVPLCFAGKCSHVPAVVRECGQK